MLKVLRDNLKQLAWVLWLVILALVILIFVDFGGARAPINSPTASAATVGDETISYAAFERQYRALEDNYRSLYGENFSEDMARQLRLPIQALDTLIAQKILNDEARRLNLTVGNDELRRAILEIPAFTDESGSFVGRELYSDILRRAGYSVAEFEDELRGQLLREKLANVLADTVYISETELERESRERAEKATIRFVRLPPNQLAAEVTVEEEELRAAFEANREEYRLPEQRVVDYLLVKPNDLRPSLEVSEEELREYYEENTEEFTQEEQVRARHILLFESEERSAEEARSQLEELRRRIEAGEDFAALAQEYSEDEATKGRGGELGFFGRGRMAPAFEEAAFGAEKGDLVGPIQTSLGPRTGFHLIEVEDKREGATQSFEEVEQRIRSRLLNEKARERAEAKAGELAEGIRSGSLTSREALRTLAETEQVDFTTTEPFSSEDNLPGIGRGTPFSSAAFELQPGEISDPVRIPAGWAILSLAEIKEPRLPEFEEVRDQVRAEVMEEKQKSLARERLEEWRREIETGKSLEEAASALGVEIQDSGEFGRQGFIRGLGYNEEIVEAALSREVGELGGPVDTPQGAVLFEVVDRRHWDPAAFEEEKEALREELTQERINALQLSIVEQRRADLQVTYNQQLLQDFGVLEEVSTGL